MIDFFIISTNPILIMHFKKTGIKQKDLMKID